MRFLPLLVVLAACSAPERRIVRTDAAPAPIGPYSQAVLAGDTLHVAGQVGLDPATGKMVEGGIRPETRRVLDNLLAVLAAAGFGPRDVVQASVYLADLAEFPAMNEIYATVFDADPPARATVQVAALPKGARVEIALVAVRR